MSHRPSALHGCAPIGFCTQVALSSIGPLVASMVGAARAVVRSMAKTKKLSVSIAVEEVKWVRARAKRARVSVSSVMTVALRKLRQQEARQAFLDKLAADERATARDVEEIRREWRRV